MRRTSSQSSVTRNDRGVSPAISTVILTGAIVVLIIIAVVFANNFLNTQIAKNDFSAMEQFMQTAALQLDNVAWTIGRTQTISYTSKYGQVNFQTAALSYAVYNGTSKVAILTNTTGIILFNVPTNEYSISNNYFQRIYPSSNGSFLQQGTSAPIAQVFAIEKLPMSDGSYVRVVLAPTIRMLNSKIGNQTYYEFYLPCLVQGSHPYYSQSITIATQNVATITFAVANPITININVTFPNAALGFSSSFFNFQSTTVPVHIKSPSIVEFYVGEVIVSLGLYA
jgi:type II secretory pathway pseudopilin PulG